MSSTRIPGRKRHSDASGPCFGGVRTNSLLEWHRFRRYGHGMPDDLYDRDVLAWSEQQATLLRRAARGERVNDIGLDACRRGDRGRGPVRTECCAFLSAANPCPLAQIAWMARTWACRHWRSEIVAFQTDAPRRFTPSMRQRIDPDAIYARAVLQIEPLRYGGRPALAAPTTCPVPLDALLSASCGDLEAAFRAAFSHCQDPSAP